MALGFPSCPDVERAVRNFAQRANVDLIVAEAVHDRRGGRVFGRDIPRMLREIESDALLVRPGVPIEDLEQVTVISDERPFDPLKVRMANAVAASGGAAVQFLHAVAEDASDEQIQAIRDYHAELVQLCTVPTSSHIVPGEEPAEALLEAARDADVVVTLADEGSRLVGGPLARFSRKVGDRIGGTVLYVLPEDRHKRTFLTWIYERLAYRDPTPQGPPEGS